VFPAHEHGSADGMWTLGAVASALAPMSANDPPTAGFACEDTLGLAAETIGFGPLAARAGRAPCPPPPVVGSLPAGRVVIEC
jgi:hypothetical protein